MDSGTYRDTRTWAETGERGSVTAPGREDGRRGPPWTPTWSPAQRPAGRPPDPPDERKPPADRLTRTEGFADTGTLPGIGTPTGGAPATGAPVSGAPVSGAPT